MCGICGWVYTDPARPAPVEVIRRMLGRLRHRGPASGGVWATKNAALGHARLPIIDLSPHAAQPIISEDGNSILVCNGEIYNFEDLRSQLETRGHRFRSRSDSEVILHLWEEKGENCVHDLIGMFAFAIWDIRRELLFLARDRFGKKPLVYAQYPDRFVFGSEIKALQCDPGFRPAVSERGLYLYLAYQSVPAPYSAFDRVEKLPPAHCLTVRQGRGELREYWRLKHAPRFADTAEPPPEIVTELQERLQQSVKCRIRADVPVGAMLSGGIDSSLVVSIIARQLGQQVSTFTVGFPIAEYDERPWASEVAKRLSTNHFELLAGPEIIDLLPTLVWYYNEPFADSSALPTWLVCRLAREHVTVALSGDGGDECFAGYPRYQNIGEHALSEGFPGIWERWHRRFRDWRGFVTGRSWTADLRRLADLHQDRLLYYYRLAHFHEGYQTRLLTPEFRRRLGDLVAVDHLLERFRRSRAPSFLDTLTEIDLGLYLPDTLMTKTDVASMAHSLEVRSPFLDHTLVEFCARFPAHWKLKDGCQGKWILRRAAADLLPESILHRKKMGFGIPMDHWFRKEWRDVAHDALLSGRLIARGYFEPDYLRSLLERHQQGESWQYLIWNLMMFEHWHRRFIDGDGPPMPDPELTITEVRNDRRESGDPPR
ncbi:MAG TPA: asparagine synthase (glutamine-hydrolyzing) [Candidatus Ozemobacteraceae bacterium]|nr:asparagine synthase (glutamine-hydrolyzing) [Candidatus Ozemobacteraceae bacterium]